MLLNIETFLEDRLSLNNENISGFPSEPICSRCVARLGWDAPSPAVCCPEFSFERSICALELRSFQPTPRYACVMHARSLNP